MQKDLTMQAYQCLSKGEKVIFDFKYSEYFSTQKVSDENQCHFANNLSF